MGGGQLGATHVHQQRHLLILALPPASRVKVILQTWACMGIRSPERAEKLNAIAQKYLAPNELASWRVSMCQRHPHLACHFR